MSDTEKLLSKLMHYNDELTNDDRCDLSDYIEKLENENKSLHAVNDPSLIWCTRDELKELETLREENAELKSKLDEKNNYIKGLVFGK